MTSHDPYAELHAHSNFSFLDGASHPEEMVAEAARLGLTALALTDHDGLYGAVRFAEAARPLGLPTVFGAELAIGGRAGGDHRRNGTPDPDGYHLVVLARDPEGYARLSRVIAEAHLAGGAKGAPLLCIADLAAVAGSHWVVTTACRKGAVPAALVTDGPAAARCALDELVHAFGRDNVAVELWDHGDPLDSARNDALAELACDRGVDLIATANAHYATPAGYPVAGAFAALRARRSLEEMDGWLPAGPSAHLRSGAEQARRFSRYPGVVERAAELGAALAFDLSLVAPRLPDFPVPGGGTEMAYLRRLTCDGAARRYGPREAHPDAWCQIDHELSVIEELGFAGYFLIVWDICEFCRRNGIYCQGRGSAANSAVCYALGITCADAVALGLLFERFLSPERDGPPDIDVDIESGRREEVIQYVYERYGRLHAAQVANVITYRPRSALRDAARALGYGITTIGSWSRHLERHGRLDPPETGGIPAHVVDLARRFENFPRHLGIHSGGMVLCDRPVVEVCPVEWATMPGRTVLQWDKDDCAMAGLVKFDLLGLGMLEALHRCVDLIATFHGVEVDLAKIPQEDAVYAMLCAADTVGVFQVESRAQMGTLPRLAPTCFYDLVVEVALIRPGPIQGGSVHPYLRRRAGREPVTYPHPLLEASLRKTLGVPLFQEQLMQMAIDAAGFTPAEADKLRQAMGSKRSAERMEALRQRFYAGMAERGITGKAADEIFSKMAAFANFGFPESHSVSFAYLVYASAWLKLHYPGAFLAALLNSQPMGFWSPRTLVADARRHGVVVRRPEVNVSGAEARLEPVGGSGLGGPGLGGPGLGGPGDGAAGDGAAVRLGLISLRGIGPAVAERVECNGPYRDLEDLARRCTLTTAHLEALAAAGATASLDGGRRRESLWAAGALGQPAAVQQTLPGVVVGADAPPLPELTFVETVIADMETTGISVDSSVTELVRPSLDARGVVTADRLKTMGNGALVTVAGVVTHRQRPETARGITFVNLEDETGLVNVIFPVAVWARHRAVANTAPALVVRGRLEAADGVVNVNALAVEELVLAVPTASRDFC